MFTALLLSLALMETSMEKPFYESQLIFPLEHWHNHGSSIIECLNGDLLACWFNGSGERTADDVKILGARKRKGAKSWSKPFLMADTPNYPDCNPCLFIDPQGRLWLLWITILDHHWESSLLKYKISVDYQRPLVPKWSVSEVLHVTPDDDEFVRMVNEDCDRLEKMIETLPIEREQAMTYLTRRRQQAAIKLSRRLGWMTRLHPFVLPSPVPGKYRMIVPLYSDNFDFSLMAISDDDGTTWKASQPLISIGGVQPSLVLKKDGTIATYMRDNGIPPQRALYSESKDGGFTWSQVIDTDIPNPGSSLELIRLKSGEWLMVCNDTERGRHRIAAMVSDDEGKSWKWKRYLENDAPGTEAGSYSYPSVMQAKDGFIHVTYSHALNRKDLEKDEQGRPKRSAIKWVRFNLEWVKQRQ
jgi:predicted neuraminidase